jgi:hypothetical protein
VVRFLVPVPSRGLAATERHDCAPVQRLKHHLDHRDLVSALRESDGEQKIEQADAKSGVKAKSSKRPNGPITLKELMRMSEQEIRECAYSKPRPIKPDAPYSYTGKLGPDDLRRWRKPEKSIEIIG